MTSRASSPSTSRASSGPCACSSCPRAVQEQVEQGALPPATAYEVSKLDDPTQQVALASRVVAEKLSRAQTVDAVNALRGAPGWPGKAARKPTSRVFRRMAGCTVTVENRGGLDAATIRAALSAALDCLDAETPRRHRRVNNVATPPQPDAATGQRSRLGHSSPPCGERRGGHAGRYRVAGGARAVARGASRVTIQATSKHTTGDIVGALRETANRPEASSKTEAA